MRAAIRENSADPNVFMVQSLLVESNQPEKMTSQPGDEPVLKPTARQGRRGRHDRAPAHPTTTAPAGPQSESASPARLQLGFARAATGLPKWIGPPSFPATRRVYHAEEPVSRLLLLIARVPQNGA